TLGEQSSYAAVGYTVQTGAVALLVTSLYCRNCHTRYFPDYYVCRASERNSERIYYSCPVPFISAAEYSFFDSQLWDWISQQYAWAMWGILIRTEACRSSFLPSVSAERIAIIYNQSMHLSRGYLADLSAEVVMDVFFIGALLRWMARQERTLHVHHHSVQSLRFEEAMKARNRYIAGTGQDQWAHACDGCMKVKTDAMGRRYRITACVMDGICIGHPCCSFKDADGLPCRVQLSTPRDRFCSTHSAEILVCAVRDCTSARGAGFQTCNDSAHRTLENSLPQSGTSMRELLARKERNAHAKAARSTGKSSKTRKGSKTAAVFRRTFTHNEQLLVRPCGIIVSRCTMFQSEAISAAKASADFVMSTFPETFPGSKPTYLFYDNNCQLHKYIASPGHPKVQAYWLVINKPVDVFHFECKHAETDEVCQQHCNPALFPDLMTEGRWTFNSSAAEQTNAWLVRFKTILREMGQTRYEFFLDEIIRMRNEWTVERLRKKGMSPHMVPQEDLRLAEIVL
ncbi:hypothetical protein EXIGLDRAFT_627672, partial [Exidia glandulosa HHB12029]